MESSLPQPLTTSVTLGEFLNLSEHQIPQRRKRRWAHGNTGRFKQDNGGKALWDVPWHRESTRWSDHYLNHRYISFFSDEAGMREGGDADLANLTVFQRPPPWFGKSSHFETTGSRNTFQPHHLRSSSGPRARYQAGWSSKFIFFQKGKHFVVRGKILAQEGREERLWCVKSSLWIEMK